MFMSLVGKTNEEKIWNYFKSKGLNDYGCAGLIANLFYESSLKPNNLEDTGNRKLGMTDDEYTIAVDNGTYTKEQFVNDRIGYGCAQWTFHTRKKALYEYVKSKNESIGDLESQLEFLYKELNSDYPFVIKTLKTATSILEASNAMLLKYECPADQSISMQNKRAGRGQEYYNLYAANGDKKGDLIMGYVTCKKGKATKLSENFDSTEFDCHGTGCCSTTLVNKTLIEYLQKIRKHFNKPITITSGYRCQTHNKNVGSSTGSRHCKGDAADIVVSGITPKEVAKYAESIGIKGIGLYETAQDGHFVHIDTRTTKSFWYGQKQAYRSTFGGSASTFANATAAASYNVLTLGSSGSKVKKLQENLISLGYSCGGHGADGDYGSETFKAVSKFQKENNLKPIDGIAGKDTMAAIDKAISRMKNKIEITASVLNVRAGAGTNFKIVATTKKGTIHELLEEKSGWGKISNGWISSSYYKKI